MSGIVAFVGEKSCVPVLVEGLRRLEYRGYESAGLAVQTAHGIEVMHAARKLGRVFDVTQSALSGSAGIGHASWASNEGSGDRAPPPHMSGPIAVVHDGIIESHLADRIAGALADGAPTLASAVRRALGGVRGAYAIAVVSNESPDELVVATHDSPLVVGCTADGTGTFASSDVSAVMGEAHDVVFLEDGELAVLRKDHYVIRRIADGATVLRSAKRIDWSIGEPTEIHERPAPSNRRCA